MRFNLKVIILKIRNTLMAKNSEITYEGIYKNFSEVEADYGIALTYSTDSAHMESLIAAREAILGLKQSATVLPDWSTQRHNLLPVFISGLNFKEFKILDIGGGFAETFLHIKLCNNAKIDYRVLELDKIALAAEVLYENFEEIEYFTDKHQVVFDPNIVYFGSSLQYFEDYKDILNFAFSNLPKYVVISDTPMGQVETFACAQVNMKDNIIPRWVFGLSEIKAFFFENGFRLIHESQLFYPFHNFNNYANPYNQISHTNLIFVKFDDI